MPNQTDPPQEGNPIARGIAAVADIVNTLSKLASTDPVRYEPELHQLDALHDALGTDPPRAPYNPDHMPDAARKVVDRLDDFVARHTASNA